MLIILINCIRIPYEVTFTTNKDEEYELYEMFSVISAIVIGIRLIFLYNTELFNKGIYNIDYTNYKF